MSRSNYGRAPSAFEIPIAGLGHSRSAIAHFRDGKWNVICYERSKVVETHPASDLEESRIIRRQWTEKGKVSMIGPRDDEDDDADDSEDDEDE